MPRTSRLLAGAAAAALCLGPGVATPALAATHHKSHAKRLTLKMAKAAARSSAAPLILDAADQVTVTGCTKAGSGYSCGLQLHAANSASVCKWTVVVKMTKGVATVATYSHIDCAG